MTTLREAAQQALEAMEVATNCLDGYYIPRGKTTLPEIEDASTNLRAALAEPVQEPVAWMVYTLDGKSVCVTDNPADFTDEHKVLPLYTAPPQQPDPDRIHTCSICCAKLNELRDKLENMKGNPNEDVQGYGV